MDIEFRQWTLEDNETIVQWVKEDPSILPSMMMDEGLNEWEVRSTLLNMLQVPGQVRLIGEVDGDPVVAAAAFDVRPHEKTATVSMLVSPFRRDGFTAWRGAQEAIRTAFNGIGFTRLSAVVSKDNKKALQLVRMLGFKDLGVRVLQLEKDEENG